MPSLFPCRVEDSFGEIGVTAVSPAEGAARRIRGFSVNPVDMSAVFAPTSRPADA